jgi:hypothetical protein
MARAGGKPPAASSKPGGRQQPSSVQRGDPFEKPADGEEIALLPRDLEHPLAEAAADPGPPVRLDRPSRGAPAVPPRRHVARQVAPVSRYRARLGLVLGAAALVMVAGVALVCVRPAGKKPVAPSRPAPQLEQVRVLLALEPADATVQIDQLPAVGDDLFLGQGTSHVLLASAPGRITRKFSFEVKSGLELSVHLGRKLVPPSPSEPEPSANEPVGRHPTKPATRDEIARAFVKLERYAKCLAVLGIGEGEAHAEAGAAAPNTSQMSACIRLLDEANRLAPALPQLHAAAQAYLHAAHTGKKLAILQSQLAAFSAEYLAVRAGWQLEELARQEAEEGQTAAWHMRRLALAAQAWLRQHRGGTAAARGRKDSLAKLDEAVQAFADYARRSPKEMAQVAGADKFVAAAKEVVAIAHGDASRTAAATAACRKLIEAFNALVVG